MSKPKKRNTVSDTIIGGFNLDDRYATKRDLINSEKALGKDIQNSNRDLKQTLGSKIDVNQKSNQDRFNQIQKEIKSQSKTIELDIELKIISYNIAIIAIGLAILGLVLK